LSATSEVRVPLAGRRELRAARWVQRLVVLSVHDVEHDVCTSGPLAVREDDIEPLLAVLAALAKAA